MQKRNKIEGESEGGPPVKKAKLKKVKKSEIDSKPVAEATNIEPLKGESQIKKGKFAKTTKPQFKKQQARNEKATTESWNDFKKKKKELRLKRRQRKGSFDVVVRAKQMGEKLRLKNLNVAERNKLLNELHSMLKGKDLYSKFVLAHDTSRIVQWLLKYGSEILKEQISKELLPNVVQMLQSKYGIFAVKRLLKYGSQTTKKAIIDKFYGNAVKLTSHAISAPVFEYGYSQWATPLQKQHLIQEFYGDMYKNSKDDEVKHLRDVIKNSPGLKDGVLGAIKANLNKILNKGLLDSGLVQTVIYEFFMECSSEDKQELISQLIPHIVVISNSKDGVRAAMEIIWHGSNKDRKLLMKTIKDHLVDLCKHEYGHCTIITLIDTVDDTVLLHKIILSEILKNATDLAQNEWGRKVLMWLVAPGDTTCFHPSFVKEIEEGRTKSSSKKSSEIRRNEILNYSIGPLLDLIVKEPKFWLSKPSIAFEMVLILKAGGDESLKALKQVIKEITSLEWKINVDDKEIYGIEDAGFHMSLKKLAQNDKVLLQNGNLVTFGKYLLEELTDDVLDLWLTLNRGCFLLVTVWENGSEEIQQSLKAILLKKKKLLSKQKSTGAKILLKQL